MAVIIIGICCFLFISGIIAVLFHTAIQTQNYGAIAVMVFICIIFIISIFSAVTKKRVGKNTKNKTSEQVENAKIKKEDATIDDIADSILCQNCGSWVDKNSQLCSNCGANIKTKNANKNIFIILIFIALLSFGIWFFMNFFNSFFV